MGCFGSKVHPIKNRFLTDQQINIFDSFQNPILIIKKSIIIHVNSCCCIKFGYTDEDMIGKNYQDFISDDSYFIANNKENIHITLSNTNLNNDLKIINIIIDNTIEEKTKLLESLPEQMLFTFEKFGNNPEDCKFSYISNGSKTIYNLKPELILQNPLSIIGMVLPDCVDSFIESVNKSYTTLEMWNWDGKVKVDNCIKILKCQSMPTLISENPRIVKWHGNVCDVSQAYENGLEYENLISTANAPIIGIEGNNLSINVWNNNIALLTGFSMNEVIGNNILDYILEEFKPKVREILNNAMNGIETTNYQLPFITKNKERLELIINSTTRRIFQGKIVGVIGIGKDVTELLTKTKEKAKIDNELELQNKVIAGVLHEVRNPLNVTIGVLKYLQNKFTEISTWHPLNEYFPNGKRNPNLDNLRKKVFPNISKEVSNVIKESIENDKQYFTSVFEEVLDDISIGIECTGQQLKVLNGMLTQAQLEQGELVLSQDKIDLYKLCQIQIRMISKLVNKNVKTVLTCPENIIIEGDEKHISQILTNLLSNASKVTITGCVELIVNVINIKNNVCKIKFVVKDSGEGFNKTKKNNLLKAEQFRHSDFRHGSGLGLCITIGLLKLMNSKLVIDSQPFSQTLKKGSEFSFIITVPLLNNNNNNNNTTEIKNIIYPIKNINILIVDDEKLNHIMLKKHIQIKLDTSINNIHIYSCYSGEECLELLSNQEIKYDLIIMDENMGQNSLLGSEAVKKIREKEYPCKIIHSSGNCTEENNQYYLESGSDHVWGKPVPFDNIQQEICKVMS